MVNSAARSALVGKLVSTAMLLVFLWLTAVILLSSVLSTLAEHAIENMEKSKSSIDAVQIENTLARLQRSAKLFNIDGTADLLFARLYLLSAKDKYTSHHANDLNAAISHARQAINAQPSHFLAWSLLALAQQAQSNGTWQDQQALTNSLVLGPFEKENQVRLLPLLIEQWQWLTPENQQLGIKLIGAAFKHPLTAYLAVKAMINFNQVCPFAYLVTNEQLKHKITRQLALCNVD